VPDFSWTPAAVTELKRRFYLGESYSQIGRGLGCSRSAAISKAQRLGLERIEAAAPKPVGGRPPASRTPASRPVVSTVTGMVNSGAGSSPRAPSIPRVERAYASALTLLELGARQCRWPVGPETGLHQLFCAAPTAEDASYCARHNGHGPGTAHSTYQPVSKSELIRSLRRYS